MLLNFAYILGNIKQFGFLVMSQNPQNQRFLCNLPLNKITQYIFMQVNFEPSKITYTKQQRREISSKYIYINHLVRD